MTHPRIAPSVRRTGIARTKYEDFTLVVTLEHRGHMGTTRADLGAEVDVFAPSRGA